MTDHPEWLASLADGTPFTLADLNKLVDSIEVPELADDEPPELARLTKDEFDREETRRIQHEVEAAVNDILPGTRVLTGNDAAEFARLKGLDKP